MITLDISAVSTVSDVEAMGSNATNRLAPAASSPDKALVERFSDAMNAPSSPWGENIPSEQPTAVCQPIQTPPGAAVPSQKTTMEAFLAQNPFDRSALPSVVETAVQEPAAPSSVPVTIPQTDAHAAVGDTASFVPNRTEASIPSDIRFASESSISSISFEQNNIDNNGSITVQQQPSTLTPCASSKAMTMPENGTVTAPTAETMTMPENGTVIALKAETMTLSENGTVTALKAETMTMPENGTVTALPAETKTLSENGTVTALPAEMMTMPENGTVIALKAEPKTIAMETQPMETVSPVILPAEAAAETENAVTDVSAEAPSTAKTAVPSRTQKLSALRALSIPFGKELPFDDDMVQNAATSVAVQQTPAAVILPNAVIPASAPTVADTLPLDTVSAVGAASRARTQTMVEVVEQVCDAILVSHGTMRGEGTVQIRLKEDVLDGAVVQLEAKDSTLTVSFQPKTSEAQHILEQNITQFEQHLAGRIHQYRIAVAVRRDNKNERI